MRVCQFHHRSNQKCPENLAVDRGRVNCSLAKKANIFITKRNVQQGSMMHLPLYAYKLVFIDDPGTFAECAVPGEASVSGCFPASLAGWA